MITNMALSYQKNNQASILCVIWSSMDLSLLPGDGSARMTQISFLTLENPEGGALLQN